MSKEEIKGYFYRVLAAGRILIGQYSFNAEKKPDGFAYIYTGKPNEIQAIESSDGFLNGSITKHESLAEVVKDSDLVKLIPKDKISKLLSLPNSAQVIEMLNYNVDQLIAKYDLPEGATINVSSADKTGTAKPVVTDDSGDGTSDNDPPADVSVYADWKKEQVVAELEKRELEYNKKGKVADLILVLEEDDKKE